MNGIYSSMVTTITACCKVISGEALGNEALHSVEKEAKQTHAKKEAENEQKKSMKHFIKIRF